MKDLNKLIVPAIVALVVAVVVVYFQSSPTVVVTDKEGKEIIVGAFPGPDITTDYLSVNGVKTYYYSSGLKQASTTLCMFKTPSATSTLDYASVAITTGTSSATVIDIAKSSITDATTTLLGYSYNLPSSEPVTINASTTIGAGGLVTVTPVFGPSQYFTVKIGGFTGWNGLVADANHTNNGLVGSCKATFLVN